MSLSATNSSLFGYKERVVVAPWYRTTDKATFARVRIETHSNTLVDATATPFSPLARELLERFRVNQILIQTSSSSTFSSAFLFDANDMQGDDYFDPISPYTSPSGVSILARFLVNEKESLDDQQGLVQAQFAALLSYLVEHRIVLASLDSVSSARLHRWIHVEKKPNNIDDTNNIWQLQVVLPTEGSPMSAEGVKVFQSALSPPSCFNKGVLNYMSAATMSNLLLGTWPTTTFLFPRSTWIDLRSSCHDNLSILDSCRLHVHQGIQYGVVLDTASASEENGNLALSNLLPETEPQHVFRTCPVAESTLVESYVPTSDDHTLLETARLNDGDTLDQVMIQLATAQHEKKPLVGGDWTVTQTIQRPRGVSNTGTLATTVQHTNHKNAQHDCAVMVNLTMIIPDFVKPKWQTFRIMQGQEQLDKHSVWYPTKQQQDDWMIEYNAVFHDDGTVVMKLDMNLGTNSKITALVDYDPVLLAFEEFPGDPNRGMEMPPAWAVITAENASNCGGGPKIFTLYSKSPLLLMPPVPDMSMPFNVISLTCTLYAFLFGTVLNLLVRKSSERMSRAFHNKPPPKNKLQLLKIKFAQKLKFLKKNPESSQQRQQIVSEQSQGMANEEQD